jgi:hypothetical protein
VWRKIAVEDKRLNYSGSPETEFDGRGGADERRKLRTHAEN